MVDAAAAQEELAFRELARRAGVDKLPRAAQEVILGLKPHSAVSPEAAANPNAPGKLSSFAYGAADTAGSGVGDELAAGVVSAAGGDYEAARDKMRENQDAAQKANPWTYRAGNLAGAGAQLIATGGYGGLIKPAATLASTALRGGGLGAIIGALHGAGSGTDASSRASGAAVEGGVGAGLGSLLPIVGAQAGAAYRSAADGIRGAVASKASGISPEILRLLAPAIEPDMARGGANIAAAGPDAMLADAGPNAQALLDTAIQRGGAGSATARTAIEDRASRATQDVAAALDRHLGPAEGVATAKEGIRTNSQAARSGTYKDAYSKPIDYSHPDGQAIEQIVNSRVPKNIIDEANKLMRVKGETSKQIHADVAEDGTVTFRTLPDVAQLDYITRALNAAAEGTEGTGALGGQSPLGAAYKTLSQDIRGRLRGLVPEYGVALDTAREPIQQSKALDFGVKAMRPGTTRSEVIEGLKGLGASERDAVKQGVRSHLDEVLSNVTRTVQDPNVDGREAVKALKDLSSRAAREKVGAVIGDKEADAFFAALDQAAKSFDLKAGVVQNSKTYARQATERRVEQATAPGALERLQAGEPLKATQNIMQAVTGAGPTRTAARKEQMWSEIVDALTRPAGQGQTILNTSKSLLGKDRATELMVNRIAQSLGSPAPAGPVAAQINSRRGR